MWPAGVLATQRAAKLWSIAIPAQAHQSVPVSIRLRSPTLFKVPHNDECKVKSISKIFCLWTFRLGLFGCVVVMMLFKLSSHLLWMSMMWPVCQHAKSHPRYIRVARYTPARKRSICSSLEKWTTVVWENICKWVLRMGWKCNVYAMIRNQGDFVSMLVIISCYVFSFQIDLLKDNIMKNDPCDTEQKVSTETFIKTVMINSAWRRRLHKVKCVCVRVCVSVYRHANVCVCVCVCVCAYWCVK